MKARLLLRERQWLDGTDFFEMVVWELPVPTPGSRHGYKYRLALIEGGRCVLRYDNETGKGDHRHIGDTEMPYEFAGLEKLKGDFRADIMKWRSGDG